MNSMPKYEWDTAWRYHEALVTSLSAAVIASDDEDGCEDNVSGDSGDYASEDDSSDDASSDDDDESGDDEEAEDEKVRGFLIKKKIKGAETKVWGDEL